eukprot:TRINITY_DN5905_c1_g1_i1.p1 TRINITY_DN5905_c1_g1~~TRINITY_DN5905_c1_g1_i1.p1  ORF type:complete len:240 (+),score=46.55 TRINITY_DN5905_c1_g1_i1:34-753(+)
MDMQESYNALVVGASGSVGRRVVQFLSASPACARITAIGRRRVEDIKDPKVIQEVVDFENLEQETARIASQMGEGKNVAYCTIGIGKPTSTSQQDIEKVELEYVGAFGRGAFKGGVQRMQVFTGVGADPNSSMNMLSVYGRKEKILQEIGFPHLSIFRPSVILGNAHTPGVLNFVVPILNCVVPSQYQGIQEEDLAKALVADVEVNPMSPVDSKKKESVYLYEFKEMQAIISKWKNTEL